MLTKLKLTALAAAVASGTTFAPAAGQAQEYWIGQIVMGGWNFCPRSTTPAAGQLLAVQQYTALFSLYGTTYGGDGRTTFGLPDLRGRTAVAQGQGPGLSRQVLGQKTGAETVTLNQNNLPAHTHTATGVAVGLNTPGSSPLPTSNMPSISTSTNFASPSGGGAQTDMAAGSVKVTVNSAGGNAPVSVMQPTLAVQYCVVLQGLFPSRN